jgi:hypothetical protein
LPAARSSRTDGDVVSFVFFPNVATVSAAEGQKNAIWHVTPETAPSSSVQEGSHYLAAGRSRRLQWTFLGGGVFSALQVQVEGRGLRLATIIEETDEAVG